MKKQSDKNAYQESKATRKRIFGKQWEREQPHHLLCSCKECCLASENPYPHNPEGACSCGGFCGCAGAMTKVTDGAW